MKPPNITSSFGLAFVAVIALISPVYAIVTIDYVSVGNAGNAADGSGYGAVAYAYNIGKYEVTNAQYAEFLNAKGATNSNGIYNVNMATLGITQSGGSGSFSYSVTGTFENKPVVCISWYDAARFANWLLNGQGSGDMETGAYTLNGNLDIINKNPGAAVWIPTENEWYKAAYYQGNGTYSLYPNGQNSITTADANFNSSASTDVGAYAGDSSFYGTFDQGGNALEWNDGILFSVYRGQRGGSRVSPDNSNLASSWRTADLPTEGNYYYGFRLASIPEPTSFVLTVLAGGVILIRRKR